MELDEDYGTDEFWQEQERLAEEEKLMDKIIKEDKQ